MGPTFLPVNPPEAWANIHPVALFLRFKAFQKVPNDTAPGCLIWPCVKLVILWFLLHTVVIGMLDGRRRHFTQCVPEPCHNINKI